MFRNHGFIKLSFIRKAAVLFSKTHKILTYRSSTFLAIDWRDYNMASPGNKLRFDLTPSDIKVEADKLMVKSKEIFDQIGTLPDDQVSLKNVVQVSFYNITS